MPNLKTQLDALLNQEMDRKNFLKYSGGILLGVLGITGLLRILLTAQNHRNPLIEEPKKGSGGYGASRYGQ